MKDDKLYLLHIQEAITRINTYVADGKQQFISSTLIQDAVLRNFPSSHALAWEFRPDALASISQRWRIAHCIPTLARGNEKKEPKGNKKADNANYS